MCLFFEPLQRPRDGTALEHGQGWYDVVHVLDCLFVVVLAGGQAAHDCRMGRTRCLLCVEPGQQGHLGPSCHG